MTQYAAVLFALASAGIGAFQVALALGAPWGEFTLEEPVLIFVCEA
jgi:hypothetical protein